MRGRRCTGTERSRPSVFPVLHDGMPLNDDDATTVVASGGTCRIIPAPALIIPACAHLRRQLACCIWPRPHHVMAVGGKAARAAQHGTNCGWDGCHSGTHHAVQRRIGRDDKGPRIGDDRQHQPHQQLGRVPTISPDRTQFQPQPG
jgi:hypothetical protein